MIRKFFKLLGLFTVASVMFYSQSSLALSPEQRRAFDSGIYYFDVEPVAFCGSGDARARLSTDDNIAIIFNFLVNKGLTDFQAAGVLGNIHHESGYEPMRAQGIFDRLVPGEGWEEAKGGGWGLVQWTPGSKIVDPVIAAGKDVNNIYIQLEFLWGQLTNTWPEDWIGGPPSSGFNEKSAGDHLRSTTSVAEATLSFETKYERHKGSPQPSRITEAERILELSRVGGIAETSGNSGGCNTGNGDVVATALSYAWPDWRPSGSANAREMKPEYEQAVKTAQSNGRYVGGISYPGIDCGGFVTTVIIDSGFDSSYNHSGSVANGAGFTGTQLTWVRQNWELVGKGNELTSADLQPGDVAFQVKSDGSNDGHTFMWVGDQPDFQYPVASAALDERTGMAGAEKPFANNIEWYRKR